MEFDEISLIVLVIVGCIFYEFILSGMEKERTKAIKSVAKKMDFSFAKSSSQHEAYKEMGFELFSGGTSCHIKNSISGKTSEGDVVSMFDYHYAIRANGDTIRSDLSVFTLSCNSASLPNFLLKPEGIFEKMSRKDIDFDAYPTFSKKYFLSSDDEKSVRETFTPSVIEYLESHLDLYIEVKNNTFIFYSLDKKYEPEQLPDFYRDAQTAFLTFVSSPEMISPQTI